MSYGAATAGSRTGSVRAPLTGGIGTNANYAAPVIAGRPSGVTSAGPTLSVAANGTITVPLLGTTLPAGNYTYRVTVSGKPGTQYAGAASEDVTFTLNVPAVAIPTGMSYGAATAGSRTGSVRAPLTGGIGTNANYAAPVIAGRPSGVTSAGPTLSVAANGTITVPLLGTTLPAGNYTYRVTVSGKPGTQYAGAASEDVTFTLNVPAVAIPTGMSYGAATAGSRTGSVRAPLTGGIGTNANYAAPVIAGRPSGVTSAGPTLSVAANGTITVPLLGTTLPAGNYTYRVTVSGKPGTQYAGAASEDVTFTLNVPAVAIPTGMSYGAATAGSRTGSVRAPLTGGIGTNANYAAPVITRRPSSVTSGGPTLSVAANGTITVPLLGTTLPAGNYTYRVTVSGKPGTQYAGAASEDVTFTLNVPAVAVPTMSYAPTTGTRRSNITSTLTGGTSDFTYTQRSVVVPTGVSSSSAPALSFGSTGNITGPSLGATVPAGAYTYTITVSGRPGTIYAGATATESFTLTVPAVAIPSMSYSAVTGTRGSAITSTLSGGTSALSYTQSSVRPSAGASAASAPALTFDSSGNITGPSLPTTTDAGTYSYTITVRARAGTQYTGASSRNVPFTLTVPAASFPSSMSYANTSVLRGNSATVPVSNTSGATATYAFMSATPSWLTINSSTGAITAAVPAGTAVVGPTSYPVTVTGTGIYNGNITVLSFRLTVTQNLPASMSYNPASVARGSRVSAVGVNNAAGVTATYAFAASPAAPSWLRIDRSTGRISANAAVPSTTAGSVTTYRVNVTGTGNYQGSTRALDFVLTVTQPLPNTLSYANGNGSRFSTININEQLDDTALTLSFSTLTAADASFAFVPTTPSQPKPSGITSCPSLNLSSTGTITASLPTGIPSANYIYTVRVTGQGLYSGTRDVRFTLTVTGGGGAPPNATCP